MAYSPIFRSISAEGFLPLDNDRLQKLKDWKLLPPNEGGYRLLFETNAESGKEAAKCEAVRQYGSRGTAFPMAIAVKSCLDAAECLECSALYCALYHRMRRYFSRRGIRLAMTERILVGWILEKFADVDSIRTDTMPMDEYYVAEFASLDAASPTVFAWGVSSDDCLNPL